MEFSGAIISGLLSTISYFIIFFGVYKLHQIATEIREIKDLMKNAQSAPRSTATPAPALAPEIARNLLAEDSATAYAQSLLRAVNAESQGTASEPREVR